jgi:hypothetical protein
MEAPRMPGNRNVLYLIIGVLSNNLYQAKKQPEGFQVKVSPKVVKIQGK